VRLPLDKGKNGVESIHSALSALRIHFYPIKFFDVEFYKFHEAEVWIIVLIADLCRMARSGSITLKGREFVLQAVKLLRKKECGYLEVSHTAVR
jgi:hypothetical protein